MLCVPPSQEKQAQQEVAAAEQQRAAQAEEEEDLSVFEIRRRANIRRNQERMASMGLTPPPLPGHLFTHPSATSLICTPSHPLSLHVYVLKLLVC